MKCSLLSVGLAAALAGAGGLAQAQTYSFGCVTNNKAADCAIGESQLKMLVTQNVGSVDFKFTNVGSFASSITDIYFDWLNSAQAFPQGTITDSGSGVSFAWGATPRNLPGGVEIGFQADLAVDSNAPTQRYGVNPGEWLNVRFVTASTNSASDLYSGALRVGMHVQGFAGGGSESFATFASPVPEPGSVAMMLAGLGVVGVSTWRRRRG